MQSLSCLLFQGKSGRNVVKFDGLPYPGIIQNVDANDIEVKVMHRIGTNRYFLLLFEDAL